MNQLNELSRRFRSRSTLAARRRIFWTRALYDTIAVRTAPELAVFPAASALTARLSA
jgi:hypothetical protein